jgi:hypothetical protein
MDEGELEKSLWYDLGSKVCRVAIGVAMVGIILAKDDYSSGDDVPLLMSTSAVMAFVYGSYYCERMSSILRTGVDPWEGVVCLGIGLGHIRIGFDIYIVVYIFL